MNKVFVYRSYHDDGNDERKHDEYGAHVDCWRMDQLRIFWIFN